MVVAFCEKKKGKNTASETDETGLRVLRTRLANRRP